MLEYVEAEKTLLRTQLKGIAQGRDELLAKRMHLQQLMNALRELDGPGLPDQAAKLQNELLQNLADDHVLRQRHDIVQNQIQALCKKQEQPSREQLRAQVEEDMNSYHHNCSGGDDSGTNEDCCDDSCNSATSSMATAEDGQPTFADSTCADDVDYYVGGGMAGEREAALGFKRQRTASPLPQLVTCTICFEVAPLSKMLSAGAPSISTATTAAAGIFAAAPPATPTSVMSGALLAFTPCTPHSGAASTSLASTACAQSTSTAEAGPSTSTPCTPSTSTATSGPSASSLSTPSSSTSSFACSLAVAAEPVGTNWRPCEHYCCRTCMQQYVKRAVRAQRYPVACPKPGCTATLDHACLQGLMDNYYDSKALQECEVRHALPAKERLYCPHKACSVLMLRPAIETPNAPSTCIACGGTFCATCLIPGWHEGISCEALQALPPHQRTAEDAAFLKLSVDRRWKACPCCNMMVERSQGCSHMTCRCGAEFCYSCGTQYRVAEARKEGPGEAAGATLASQRRACACRG